MKIAPELDRIFVKAGNGIFGAYQLSTFPQKVAAGPLVTGAHGERYLRFDMSVNPESPSSGWRIVHIDGNERLSDFDWDDRGFVYLAYNIWGFGIVDLQGHLVNQRSSIPPPPRTILTVVANGAYYVIVSDLNVSDVYDATDPRSLKYVRQLPFRIFEYAKTLGGTAIALIVSPTSPTVRIFTPETLISGGSAIEITPNTTFSPTTAFTFNNVTTDGGDFYVSQSGMDTSQPNPVREILSKISRTASGYELTDFQTSTNQRAVDVVFGTGYLAYLGFEFSSFTTVGVMHQFNGAGFTPMDVSSYLRSTYDGIPYTTPRQIVPFSNDSGTFAIAAFNGLGDLYELSPAVLPVEVPTLSETMLVALAAVCGLIAMIRLRG